MPVRLGRNFDFQANMTRLGYLHQSQIGDLGDKLRLRPMDLEERQGSAKAGLARRRHGQGHLGRGQGLQAAMQHPQRLL
jgi:hypothetical protein